MKKVLFIFVVLTLLASAVTVGASRLTPSLWAAEEFEAARRSGLIPESIYFSEYTADITREQFCDVFVLTYEKISGTALVAPSDNPFVDTAKANVLKAFGLGLVSGMGDGEFAPYRNITREEVAKIMWTMMEKLDSSLHPSSAVPLFADDADISEWAKGYVADVVAKGIMNGTSETEFSPKSSLSIESTVLMANRMYTNNYTGVREASDIYISSPADSSFVPDTASRLTWQYNGTGTGFTLYQISAYGYATIVSANISGTSAEVTMNTNGANTYVVQAPNGAFSKPVTVFVGEPGIRFVNSYPQMVDGKVDISWVSSDAAADFEVEIIESRGFDNEFIPPATPVTVRTWGNREFVLDAAKPRTYKITVYELDNTYERIGTSEQLVFSTGWYQNNSEYEFIEMYPMTTKAEADSYMTTIKVNVWQINSRGEKVTAQINITVHKAIADLCVAAFEEIYNGKEKFPIKSAGAYAWREPMSSGRLSEHNYGTAIDINPDENYCIYANGTAIGKYWKPYEDPYSITPYGEVMRAFEKHGFTWGGDAWSNPRDYMHFSYLGR